MRPPAFSLRPCVPADLPAMGRLFYDTIHAVCAAHYTPAQLDAWAPEPDPRWTMPGGTVLAAESQGVLLGFGSILPEGYLDLLFVHRDHQGEGIASVLCDALERSCPAREITVHASKTARPFFAGRGYRPVRTNRVERRGEILENYTMKKEPI